MSPRSTMTRSRGRSAPSAHAWSTRTRAGSSPWRMLRGAWPRSTSGWGSGSRARERRREARARIARGVRRGARLRGMLGGALGHAPNRPQARGAGNPGAADHVHGRRAAGNRVARAVRLRGGRRDVQRRARACAGRGVLLDGACPVPRAARGAPVNGARGVRGPVPRAAHGGPHDGPVGVRVFASSLRPDQAARSPPRPGWRGLTRV